MFREKKTEDRTGHDAQVTGRASNTFIRTNKQTDIMAV